MKFWSISDFEIIKVFTENSRSSRSRETMNKGLFVLLSRI